MTFEALLAQVAPHLSQGLQEQVAARTATPKQLSRLVQQLHKSSDGLPLNHVVGRLLAGLYQLRQFARTEAEVAAGIKRLSAPSGATHVLDELFMHELLTRLFHSYHVRRPLFGEGSDGLLVANGQQLDVEIKTRLSEKYLLLLRFLRGLPATLPHRADVHFTYTLHFTNIQGLTPAVVEHELQAAKDRNDINITLKLQEPGKAPTASYFGNLLTFPFDQLEQNVFIETSRNELGISYSLRLDIHPRRTPVSRISATLAGHFFSSTQAVGNEQGHIEYQISVRGSLGQEAKLMLANSIVTQTFKNSRNIPREPFLLAIASPHGSEPDGMVQVGFDRYVASHPQTAILLVDFNRVDERFVPKPLVKFLVVGTELRAALEADLYMQGASPEEIAHFKRRVFTQNAP